MTPEPTPVTHLTDDALFDAIREQVNLSRNSTRGHDRPLTRALADEALKRGWFSDARKRAISRSTDQRRRAVVS